MKYYRKITDALWKFWAYFLAMLLALLVVIVFYQVVCRAMQFSNSWTQEISTLLFVWATYLGAALAIRNGSQISMTLLLTKTHGALRACIALSAAIICEVFYGVFCWSGIAAMQTFVGVTSSALRIPMPWSYGAIAVSGILMLLLGSAEIVERFQALRQVRSGNRPIAH